MNKLAIAAVVFTLVSGPLSALAQPAAAPKPQAQPPAPAQPAAAMPGKPAPGAAAPSPGAKAQAPKRAAPRAPSSADARACLEFPTNLQVVKCAEKYR